MDTKSLVKLPGYRYNEYLLVLNPHQELSNKIMKVKKEFQEAFQATTALWGKPHIPLINFVQFEMMEEKVLNRLQTIAMAYRPFKVEMKNFGSLPTHTIFINIESKQQLQHLVRELKAAQSLLKLTKQIKPHYFENPFVTIAAKLLPWQYEKGWAEYKVRSFTGRFIADAMLLLKRRAGDKGFQIVKRFEFLNLPVSTSQGQLFN